MRNFFAPVVAAALSTAFLGFAAPARAGVVESCGLIEINADTKCEMRVDGGCMTSCTPISFTAQCSAQLYVDCNGGCNAMVTATCSASCDTACQAQCKVDPAKFDCAASCKASCSGNCDARCAGSADTNRCRSQCQSTCDGECNASCKVTPPSADCNAKCEASCTGSCDADANMQCQFDCQNKSFAMCESDLQGGCETACTRPDGALFCDGQYVEVGDKLDACVAALEDAFQIKVTGYAYGDAQCSNGSCTAEAGAGCSCAQVAVGGAHESTTTALGLLGAFAAFGLAVSRRKNQRA